MAWIRAMALRLGDEAGLRLRQLDHMGKRQALLLGSGTGAVLGLLLLWPGAWWGGVGMALLLSGAVALGCTGEPVAEAPAMPEEPARIDDPMQMVQVRGGRFLMGSPETEDGRYEDEGPQHAVEVAGLFMSATPVSQELYAKVMGDNPGDPQGAELPVNRVSWFKAVEFCNRRSLQIGLRPCYRIEGQMVLWDREADGYRLPTEAEWEYAARAGNRGAYCFGDDPRQLGEYAWFHENSNGQVQPVGKKKPNDWGLYDMHGNVWEWVWLSP